MKLNKKNIITFLISLIFVFFVFHNIDLKKLLDTFNLFNYKILLLIVPAYMFTLLLRGVRWKLLLPDNKKFEVKELSEIYTVGSALNIYLPARAGDFFRAYFLGKKTDVCKFEIFGSIVLERIFDALTVLLILLISMFAYHRTPWMMEVSIIASAIFIGIIIGSYLLFRFNKIDKFCGFLTDHLLKLPVKYSTSLCTIIEKINIWLNSFINGFQSVTNPQNTIMITILSLMIWGIDCAMIYFLVINFGFDVNFSVSLFVISFVALSTIVPSTSIYLGPYQYAFILALSIYHIDKSSALAIAFMLQTTTLILLSVISIMYFLRNNITYTDINKESLENSPAKV